MIGFLLAIVAVFAVAAESTLDAYDRTTERRP